MKIKIENDFTGTSSYIWSLETGPEHIDCYTGYCETLGECFEEIIRHRTINALEYANEKKEKAFKDVNEIFDFNDVDEIFDSVFGPSENPK